MVIGIVHPLKAIELGMIGFFTFFWSGLMRSSMERPLSNSMGVHNPIPSGGPGQGCVDLDKDILKVIRLIHILFLIDWCLFISTGHGFPQVLPGRPNIPGLNCWRPG